MKNNVLAVVIGGALVAVGIFIFFVLYQSGVLGGWPGKRSSLYIAVGRGDTNRVSELLDAGINPNLPSLRVGHPSPLIMAVKLGDADMVRLLIDHGANVNSNDFDNFSPLYYSLSSPILGQGLNGSNIVYDLISKGADLNAKGIGRVVENMSSNDPRWLVYRSARSKNIGSNAVFEAN